MVKLMEMLLRSAKTTQFPRIDYECEKDREREREILSYDERHTMANEHQLIADVRDLRKLRER